jgi:hypothetical protein
MSEKTASSENSLAELVNSELGIKVFGLPVKDVQLSTHDTVLKADATSLTLVAVKGFSIAAACIKPPKPFLLLLPDSGVDPQGECDFNLPVKKWSLLRTLSTVRFDSTSGSLESLVGDIQPYGVDGGIQFSNPRFQNGQACVTVHVWAKIDNNFPPIHVGFDTTKDLCISLDQCVTIIDIGVGKAQVCYRPPNQVCVEASIGVGPISKTWSQCITIPLSAPVIEKADCGCAK